MKWTVGVISAFLVCILILPLLAQSEWEDEGVKYDKGKTLVILLHAYTGDQDSLEGVKDTILSEGAFSGADVLQPGLPIGALSIESPHKIVARLLLEVDKAWAKRAAEGRPYENIIIVGHSVGALLARKLYVAANGEKADAPFEKELKSEIKSLGGKPLTKKRAWVEQNTRIILFAGMNRGWSISHYLSIWRAVYMQAGVAWSHVFGIFYDRQPLVMEVRRGAPFITQLRLQWLAMERAEKNANSIHPGSAGVSVSDQSSVENKKQRVVVQLLGTVDDLVSPDDNLDLVVGSDFHYLSVPYSGHANVVELDDCIGEEDARIKTGKCDYLHSRKTALKSALLLNETAINEIDFESEKIRIRPEVKDVVFVIHGIRDEGHWTKQIARRIQQEFKQRNNAGVVAAETSTYGYFPMLSFLVPGERQEKVEWFMDRYVETRALYPEARFHFVGHSHGTYVFAKALKDYSSVKFDRVVFAGSVVRQQYEWDKFYGGRVKAVLNYVATGDWVVAFFPKALQSLHLQDLGSAGHDGFSYKKIVQPEKLFVRGGHSAALNEAVWDSIAEFIVTGNFKKPPQSSTATSQSKWVAYPAYIAPLIWIAIAGLLFWILRLLFRLKIREWKKTLIILGYVFAVWTVLTKV